MKFALTILATLTLVGCSQENAQRLPTAPGPSVPPAPTTGSLTFVWAMVVDESGVCIVGATVQVCAGRASVRTSRRARHATPGPMTGAPSLRT